MAGVALRQEFLGRYGSAWMAVQHLRVLNALTTREVAQSVLCVTASTGQGANGHLRSLVDMRWYDDALEDGVADVGLTSLDTVSFVRSRALDAFAGRLAPVLARDDVVRWCPECLRMGYHAIWFQLGALDRCPMHNVALEEQCPHCHAPNEPCAVTSRGGCVFECTWCGQARVRTNVQLWRREPAFATAEGKAFDALAIWFRRHRNEPVEWAALTRDLCLRRNDEDLTHRYAARTQVVRAMFPCRGVRILRPTKPVCEAMRIEPESDIAKRKVKEVIAEAQKQVEAWAKPHHNCLTPASKIVIGEDRILMPCVPWDEVCCVQLAYTVWLARYHEVLRWHSLSLGKPHPYQGIPVSGVVRLMIGDFLETLTILSEYQSRTNVPADRLRAALRVSLTLDLGGMAIPPTHVDGTWWIVTTRRRVLPSHVACPRLSHHTHGVRVARKLSASPAQKISG